MDQVFIVGGAGNVGRRLSKLLHQHGHPVSSLYRKPEQASEIAATGATPVLGSLQELSVDELAARMAGSNVVVFSAGAGGKGGKEMTTAIDGDGLTLSVAAAQKAGVARFILVSAFPESFRAKEVSDTFEHYMAVKKLADAHLAESNLDWVILRPGTLLDTPGTGHVRAGLAIPYGEVPRDDVAATLFEIIEQHSVSRKIIELTQGEMSAAESIRRFADG